VTAPPAWGRALRAVILAEMAGFWGGAAAGLALLVFLGLSGFFFYNNVADYVLNSLDAAARGLQLNASLALFAQGLTHLPLVMLLVAPLTTMRSLAASRRGGHLDYLETLPLSDGVLILGHYLAAWINLGLLALLGLIPFAALLLLGVGEAEVLATTLTGLAALASVFAAVGLLASAVFPGATGAGLATLGLLGLMWVLGWAAPYAEDGWGAVWRGLAFAPRMNRFVLGLVDFRDLFFFAALTGLALANAKLALARRRFGGAD
jgi:ABC-type transport system involved in multi-copper enzyme maturation permease subunit